ncbi:unnamed protein product [Ceutorhynchus assimilis]|uniref:Uncharacterized protein n=1 Tax=Ceutorhynchus assimilis TaxID=467358 RepID=A0A9N9MIR2_9CUCU|nr:unnamed protein product [Ceutorhynchus assimilis]
MMMGDNVNYCSPPSTSKISLLSKTFYWIFQVLFFLFKTIWNPITWFLLKTIFHVTSEIFIYLVLGACSILIGTITQIDVYYSKNLSLKKNNEIPRRDGLRIENCTIKRFVEISQ